MRYIYLTLLFTSALMSVGGFALALAMRAYRTNRIIRWLVALPVSVSIAGTILTLVIATWSPNLASYTILLIAMGYGLIGGICIALAMFMLGIIGKGEPQDGD